MLETNRVKTRTLIPAEFPMPNLSKSKILAYRQCPKRLWLELHKPELRDDSASEVVFAIGNRVGEVARQVFDPHGNGHTIDIGILGHSEALSQSAVLLAEGSGPVFRMIATPRMYRATEGLNTGSAPSSFCPIIPPVPGGSVKRLPSVLRLRSTPKIRAPASASSTLNAIEPKARIITPVSRADTVHSTNRAH